MTRPRKPRKALTPKARVLKRWPGAFADQTWSSPPGFIRSPEDKLVWVIWDSEDRQEILGSGPSPAAAWRAAANCLDSFNRIL